MKRIHYLYLFLTILLCLPTPTSISAQSRLSEPTRHSSLDGLYAVTTPAGVSVGGGGPLESSFTEGFGYGYSTYWTGGEVYLQAGHMDFNREKSLPTERERGRLFLEAIAKLKRLPAETPGLEFVGEREVQLAKLLVTELSFQDANRKVAFRLFPTEKGIVRITGISYDSSAVPTVKSFLDSIESPTRAEIIAEKLKQATPAPLPECTEGVPIISDLVEYGLSGKAKTVTSEREDQTDGATERSVTRTLDFDVAGRLSKVASYELDGRPDSVGVFGCVDGKRVSKWGYASYENRFTGAAPPRPGAKPRDPRYSTEFVTRVDSEGRIFERLRYGNDTVLLETSKYFYRGKEIEIVDTDGDGKVSNRNIRTLDDKGRISSEVNRRFGSNGVEWRNTYKVVVFDQHGNWTKRAGEYQRFEQAKAVSSRTFTEFRTISYYR